MKKFLKSAVSVLVCAVMVLPFASCGSNSPKGVVKEYYEAKWNCDFVTLEKCCEEPGEYIEDLAKDKIKDVKSFVEYLEKEDTFEYYEDIMGDKAFDEYLKANIEIAKAVAKKSKVEIDKVTKDKDEAWVKCTTYEPELKKDSDELMEKAAKNVDLKDEYLEEDLDEKEWKKVIKEYKKLSLEQIKEADLEDEDEKIKVVKDNGKWKIAEDQTED